MLKHLLHLYNDGHNPFPNMKCIKGGMIRDETKEETMRQESKDEENDDEDLNALWEELNEKERETDRTIEAMKKQYDEHRFDPDVLDDLSILKALDPTMKFNKSYPKLRETVLDEIERSLKNARKAGYDDDELKEVFDDKIQELRDSSYMKMVYGAEYPDDDDDIDSEKFLSLPLKEKETIFLKSFTKLKDKKDKVKEKLIILKEKKDKLQKPVDIEIKKYGNLFIYNKEKGLKKEDAQRWAKTIITIASSITDKNDYDPVFISELHNKLSKLPRDELINMYVFTEYYVQTKKQSTKELVRFKFVQEMIMDIVYSEYSKVSDEYTEMHKQLEGLQDKLRDLTEKGKIVLKENTKVEKTVKKKIKEKEAEEKQEIREKKKLTHAEKLDADIQARKDKQAQELADAKLLGDLGASEPTKKSKPKKEVKKEKEVKKSKEETESDLLHADVINRLSHIDTSMSPNGKDLETYLSGNGQSILHYITGDKSKVHDNEENTSIPDVQVKLNNGELGSLRKAVTLDLYNSHNIYEIKNYKNYSSTDAVIPVQETKLEGTGYFKPLYLENGKLYNIELNYVDTTTGKKLRKLIMPENPNGRELNLIYRLSDGLYEFKPLAEGTTHVRLKMIGGMKTKGGKQLYDFDSSTFDKCVDHYGQPSFNISPYLRKVKA